MSYNECCDGCGKFTNMTEYAGEHFCVKCSTWLESIRRQAIKTRRKMFGLKGDAK